LVSKVEQYRQRAAEYERQAERAVSDEAARELRQMAAALRALGEREETKSRGS
jgi:hypothetical protein